CNEKEKENTRNVYNDIKVPIINKILSGTNAKTEPFILKPNVREYLEKYLLDNYTPPCIIINHDFDVLFIHGHTGKYLELPAGNPCMNLSGMMRDGIKIELTMAVRKVITQNNPVRYDNLRIINNENTITLNLDVQPIKIFEPARKLILIIFEEVHSIITQDMIIEPNTNKDQWISDLERDLRTKDEYLKSAIEQLETNNEELKSTNEELQSANEELQSANEELETSNEELQSLNEELSTVNSELQKKIEELSYVNNDMNNLLASTGIGTIFIDHKLYIRRFTPAASQIFKLISSDINRPISDIVSRLIDFPSLIENLGKVLDTLIPIEAEVQNTDGKRFSMKIQPYRTLENVIEGAVLTFFEINKGK
ncbi:MAG: two-component system, chemotaxis family, CheB/CheR fusion protein, partial [Bacteroidota bacterium]|nr:two-component system, chemotaxis family, CheB/CheR fusion protein [Bacteroidota bacterium]